MRAQVHNWTIQELTRLHDQHRLWESEADLLSEMIWLLIRQRPVMDHSHRARQAQGLIERLYRREQQPTWRPDGRHLLARS